MRSKLADKAEWYGLSNMSQTDANMALWLYNKTDLNFSMEGTTISPENATEDCKNDYCVSDEDYIEMILAWLFPSPFQWFLIIVYFCVFLVGIVGNFLVSFAVWRNDSMRTVTNCFIVNLAVADFLVILICLPPTVLDDITLTWYMGSYMCKIVKYLQVSAWAVDE